MHPRKLKSAAFTMVELMVTIVIVGILTAVAIPSYNSYMRKAKATEGILSVDAITRAEMTYYIAHKEFRWLAKNPSIAYYDASNKVIENFPSWEDLGYPIKPGTPTNFVYESLPGKTNGQGVAINRVNGGVMTTVNVQYTTTGISFGRYITQGGSSRCEPLGVSEYIRVCENDAAGCGAESNKKHYAWNFIYGFANLKATGEPIDNCTTIIRALDVDSRGTIRQGNLITKNIGE